MTKEDLIEDIQGYVEGLASWEYLTNRIQQFEDSCKKINCAICENGTSSIVVDIVDHPYKESTMQVPLVYQNCDRCGSSFATQSDSETNKKIIVAYRKFVDNKNAPQ
jgi:transcription elongation factor Elf1